MPEGGATVRPAQGATASSYPGSPIGSRAGTPTLYGLEADCTEDSIRSERRRGIKLIKHALPLLWVQRDGKEVVSLCSGWRL